MQVQEHFLGYIPTPSTEFSTDNSAGETGWLCVQVTRCLHTSTCAHILTYVTDVVLLYINHEQDIGAPWLHTWQADGCHINWLWPLSQGLAWPTICHYPPSTLFTRQPQRNTSTTCWRFFSNSKAAGLSLKGKKCHLGR